MNLLVYRHRVVQLVPVTAADYQRLAYYQHPGIERQYGDTFTTTVPNQTFHILLLIIETRITTRDLFTSVTHYPFI